MPRQPTTKGSLYVQGADGVTAPLPAGTHGQVLTANSTLPAGMGWATP